MGSLQRIVTLPNVQGVAPGQTFTVGFPVGVRAYELAGLEISGGSAPALAKSHITNLELLANGKPIQQFKSVTHMELISAYYGYNIGGANAIEFPWRREHLTMDDEAEKFAIGTADLATLQLRGDISATPNGAAIAAYAIETVLQPNGSGRPRPEDVRALNRLGLITKVRNFTYTLSGAGTTEIDNIPREAWLQALHLVQTGGLVTKVEAWLDGQIIWDATAARMEDVVSRYGRARQTNVYHLDWMLKNELGSQLPIQQAQDFRLKVDHSGGDTVVMYAEYLSGFGGI